MDGSSIFDDAVETGAIRVRDGVASRPVVHAKKTKAPAELPVASKGPEDPAAIRWTVHEGNKVAASGLPYDEACKLWTQIQREGGYATLGKDA